MKKAELYVYDTASDFSETLADRFIERSISAEKRKNIITVALSGGSTPRYLFKALARVPRRNMIPWRYVHLFWGDERCLPPDHPDSNFKTAKDILIKRIPIPEENIHRINGEADPQDEARRYAEEIRSIVPYGPTGIPRFDWIFLGLGSDGHTASLFPDSRAIEENESICSISVHPVTRHNRITMIMPLIDSAARQAASRIKE